MAEELAGQDFYSYNLTTETRLFIDDLVYSLEPKDLPFLTGVGSDGIPLVMRAPTANTTFKWQDERAPLPRGTVAEAVDGSETVIDVTTGDAVKFAVGDTVRIDDEYMKVIAIDTASSPETITVTRGVLGSSATTHLTGSELVGVGTTLPEGDLGSSTFKDRDLYSNYTQIFSRRVQASRTVQMVPRYGVPNELNRQMMKNFQAMMLGVEQAILYGLKYQDSTTRVRSTGGMEYFIATNENTSDSWLTIDSIHDQQQAVYDLGGDFTHLVARPVAFKALTNADGNERITSVSIDDARRGRRRATVVMTDFGDVQLVRHRWVRKTDAFGYKPAQFTLKVLRPALTEKLAKTDDTDTYSMVTELGVKFEAQEHACKWSALDPDAALPAVLV